MRHIRERIFYGDGKDRTDEVNFLVEQLKMAFEHLKGVHLASTHGGKCTGETPPADTEAAYREIAHTIQDIAMALTGDTVILKSPMMTFDQHPIKGGRACYQSNVFVNWDLCSDSDPKDLIRTMFSVLGDRVSDDLGDLNAFEGFKGMRIHLMSKIEAEPMDPE